MRNLQKVLALLLACALLCGFAWAEEAPAAQFEFRASEPDAGGLFTVTLKVSNTVFRGVQFALRYDPAVIAPADENGSLATEFGGFAQKQNESFSTAGTALDAKTGLIDLTLFLLPGTEGEGIGEDGLMTVGAQGADLYTFRFKRLQPGDGALQVATAAKGQPYREACPEGVIVLTELAGAAEVRFTGLGTEAKETILPAPEPSPVKTAESLLKSSILLPIGSYAVLLRGGVTAIYPGERSVVSYIHNNRTFVPLRFLSEKLGAAVDWDNATRTVTVQKDGHTVLLPVGSGTCTVDGLEVTMDAPAELRENRTMVPLRFVAECLQYRVGWDAEKRIAIVSEGAEWDLTGEAEQQALNNGLAMIAMYKGFV